MATGLRFAAALITATVLSAQTVAQPAAPLPPGNVTVVVAFPAGGPLDTVTRILTEKIGTKYNRTIVIENRAGAAGHVGGASVARAEPNGLTWLMTLDSVWTVNPHLGAKPSYDPDNDLRFVGQVGQVILMLAVHEKVPAKTWAELLAHSKTKSLNFGSAGIGAPGHLAFEYLKTVAPLDAVHVPFRGNAPAIQELLAGNIDGAFIAPGAMIGFVREGKIRGLAISDSKRFKPLPDIPSAPEAGLGDFRARFSNIMAVPAKTPDAVRDWLRAEVNTVLGMPDVVTRLEALGTEPMTTSEAETKAWIAAEKARWGKVVQARGLKVAP